MGFADRANVGVKSFVLSKWVDGVALIGGVGFGRKKFGGTLRRIVAVLSVRPCEPSAWRRRGAAVPLIWSSGKPRDGDRTVGVVRVWRGWSVVEQDSWRGAGWVETTGSSPEQRWREWETKGILERWEDS